MRETATNEPQNSDAARTNSTDPGSSEGNPDAMPHSVLVTRSLFGGMLMGLANLVPGISGGTMLLAAGIYPRFIDAVASATRFRFPMRSLILLACVAVAAGLSVLLFAGVLKDLVVNQRWVMYSLFIGLTLGGVPVVWRMARPATTGMIVSGIVSLALMIGLALLQMYGVVGGGQGSFLMLFIAGTVGASAMILPGLSGGYLLLLLGQYVPILSAIDQFKDALKARDISAAMSPAMSVMLPVGLGVLVGIAVVGNVLQWCLRAFPKATLGALLGLLIGSLAGLWPFQVGVPPEIGDTVKGMMVTAESLPGIDAEDWPTRYFSPTAVQTISSLGLILVGFAITMGIAAIGKEKDAA